MRIYLIDKYGKHFDIIKKLQERGIENIESKTSVKIRSTKNDMIILLDDGDTEGLSKTSKIVWVTTTKNVRNIWKFINEYNCIDIIDGNMDRDYIIGRLFKCIA